MSDSDLPKIGAPATRALTAIGITRLEQVADRRASPNYSPSTDSAHEHSAF